MRAVLCLPFLVLSSSSLDAASIQVSYLQPTALCKACFVSLLLPNQFPHKPGADVPRQPVISSNSTAPPPKEEFFLFSCTLSPYRACLQINEQHQKNSIKQQPVRSCR